MTSLDDETRAIAEAAAARLGVPASDAELIHLHSNATVALPSAGLVLRIATSPDAFDRIRGSVRVCGWLAIRGYPCTVPADTEPWTEAGRIVSVWRYEDVIPGPPASMAEFGTLLRKLHDEPVPPFQVRDLDDPFTSVAASLDRAVGGLDDVDRHWLREHIRQLRIRWRELDLAVPPGLIHGDAHPGNMLRLRNGRLIAGDWDHTATGPREWDLIQPLYTSRRFGTPDRESLGQFAAAYGADIREWDGAATLIAIREITGLSPYIRSAHANDRNRKELEHRIATLRSGDESARWKTSKD
ncbi:MAG: phosphotransferase family protein [Streptosporangiaceae bacterium]